MVLGVGTVLVIIGAGLAVGLSALGAGIGVGIAGAAAAGVTAVDPDKFGMSLVFQALPQTQGIYGLLIAILLLMSTGVLGGTPEDIPVAVGLAALGVGIAVGFSGLSAIGQGIAASNGVAVAGRDRSAIGKGLVFSVLPETQAIYGLLVAILLMAFTGMFTGVYTIADAVGFAAIGCGLAIGLAGLSAIGQGITAGAGIVASARKPEVMGRALIFAVMSETFAIFGLLIAILIMFGIGLIGGA
ncbi:MAG: V-type ATP synthase subunit K [Methanomicrobiales archaeon]|nr:V-type ATP synthase subunit K [Methanomicrobiales archaeon]